ncbi:MAG TPA: oligosaccharide flippase family protein [Papillibacter sp.]|nr:oligosaccharide flippase family protein [Papillibacter sp.]
MSRGRKVLFNTALLTLTSLLMRSVGMMFQVWLSKKIGPAGIGLFQLIMSVSALAATFSISGIRFATTRLVSEELGRGNAAGIKTAVRNGMLYALGFGIVAMLALYFGAETIGTQWIHDERTILSLRILALSLPCFALSAVLAGYFTAVTRVIKSAAVSIAEQLIRIGVVVVALTVSTGYTLETACAIVVAGGVVGEIASFLMLYVLYVFDRRRYNSRKASGKGVMKRLLGIAVPLALSAYARSALSTLENLLVPRGFKKSGASAEKALTDYGIIQGMVFPVITFPSALFYSLAELLVPELTAAQVANRKAEISRIVSRVLYFCLLFATIITVAVFVFADTLGMTIYSNADVGRYIRILSFLLPAYFMDGITDGMLRGLGQHLHSMKFNIIDSILSVFFVYFLLPRFAMAGYIFVIYFAELFNFSLSIHRLSVVTRIRLPLRKILMGFLSAVGAVNITILLLRFVGLPLMNTSASLALHLTLTAALYVALLGLTGCIVKNDLVKFKNMVKSGGLQQSA